MSQHYNAFISYKHGPLDNKVAAEVQTQLERFRIPKAIQKSTGIKKIDRIFRDKEELNITSDLNETIETALNHSDFLIVICSTHTKESIWVQREIAFFLKTHPISHVMTVVAEGEPIDVVPEILFHKEMDLMTEDGNVEKVMIPMEPLSCDYRMKFSKARKEELPRLAAAILGCGYDDLRQRQRRYRQRRNTVLSAAAGIALVSLAGYYAYTAAEIQKNYEQSLINQSEYLAVESQKMMEKGDRMTAMLLAMEALPSKDNDRPVIASAQLALSNALYAYIPQGGNISGASVGIKKSFDHSGTIDQYVISEDAAYLAVAHSGDTLTIWDFEAGEILYEEQFNTAFQNMIFTNENTLVFVTSNEVFCMEPTTGQRLWSFYYAPDLNGEGSIFRSSFISVCLAMSPTEPLMVMENENELFFIDTVTGEVAYSYEENADKYDSDSVYSLGFSHLVFSPDGTQLAGSFRASSGAYPEKQPFLYDIDSGTMYMISDYLPRFEYVMFTPEGNLVVAGSYVADEFSYTSDGYDYFWINKMTVNCYNPKENTLLWSTDFSFADYYEETHMVLSDFLLDDGTTVPAVVCGASNTIVAIDLSTGETLSTLSFEDTILYLEASEEFGLCLMKNGRIGIGYWNEFIGSTEYAVPDAESATLDPKVLVMAEDSSSLLWYSSDVYDEEWTAFEGQNRVTFGEFFFENNGCGILKGYDDIYYHIDTETCMVTWTLPIDPDGKKYEYLGYDENQNQYVFYSKIAQTISRYTLQGEFVSETPLALEAWQAPDLDDSAYPDTWEETFMAYYASDTPTLLGSMIYYPIRSAESGRYSLVVEKADSVMTIPIDTDASYFRDTFPSPDGKYILLQDNSYQYFIADLTSGTAEKTAWTLSLEETRIAWSHDSSILAAADMNCIRLFREGQETQIKTGGTMVIDLEFFGDMLLVVYADGNLIRYSAQDGSYIGQTDISANQGFDEYTSVHWDFSTEDKYAVFLDDTFNLIDPETWSVYATIGCVVSYDLEKEIVVVPRTLTSDEIVDDNKYELGYFTIYTPQELVDKAEIALNGTTLTEEQKSQYGLN